MHKMIKLMNISIILDRFLAIFNICFFIFQYKEAHMYTNNAYLNHSTIDRKDKSKPLVVTMCGTYKLYTRPKLPTWRPRGRLDFQLIYIAAGKAGAAISYALGQGATMVAALWGLFIWKEFKGASKSTNLLLTLMLILFISGLVLIIVSGGS